MAMRSENVGDDKAHETRIEHMLPSDASGDGPSEYIDGKAYWKTPKFIGTFAAIGLGLNACYAGFAMPANTLALIDADIGPSASIDWVALVWTLTVAVGYTLVGRLSDIFGRRYFFIGGAVLGLIGSIIAATAQSVNSLIGATVLLGLAASTQISFTYVTGELVLVKHRFIVNGLINLCNAPIGAFGPLIARAFIVYTDAAWRWNYYLTIMLNALSLIMWACFYFPPTFGTLHRVHSKWDEIKSIDYVGVILFTGGLLLFLMGLSWGGGQYAWDSSHTIATLVVGFVMLVVFILYETFSGVRVPLVPMGMFRNFQFDIIVVLTTVGGMIYYSMTVIYPSVLAALYSTDIMHVGLLSCAVGGGTVAGQVFGGVVAVRIGHIKYQMVFSAVMMIVFIGALAAQNDHTQALSSAFATLGCFGVGYIEILAATAATFVIDDQKQMGTPNGVFGSIRSAGGVLATTIYLAIFRNKIASTTVSIVVPALIKAGLPATSVEAFLVAINSGAVTAVEAVPGVNAKIIGAGEVALVEAYTNSFSYVFYASIAFGGCAVIAALLVRPITEAELSGNLIFHLGENAPHGAHGAAVENAGALESQHEKVIAPLE